MAGVPDVVGLLYRADWTRLSLTAEVNTGLDPGLQLKSMYAARPPSLRWDPPPELEDLGGFTSRRLTLLIAPGRRYREKSEDSASMRGCDGQRHWKWDASHEFDVPRLTDLYAHPQAPLAELFSPAPLLSSLVLDVRGPVTACGRDALHVVATPRPQPNMRYLTTRPYLKLDRIETIVDAELGILLHRQEMFDGQIVSLTQLTSVTLNPPEAADDSLFRPPPGSVIGEDPGERMREFFDHPGWQAAKTAAGLAAGGLGAWVRYSPFGRGNTTAEGFDPEPDMPPDEPEPPDPSPVSDEVLYLLYRSGSEGPELGATLHQWHDVAALMSRIPDTARDIGYGGLGSFLDAVSDRVPRTHTVATIRASGHGRYRIDYVIHPGKHQPKAIACDGQRRWTLYEDKLKVGAAAPPPSEVADLVDASWLLECRLSGGAEVTIGNRRGLPDLDRGRCLAHPVADFLPGRSGRGRRTGRPAAPDLLCRRPARHPE